MSDLCFVCSNKAISDIHDEYMKNPDTYEFCIRTARNLTKDGAIPVPDKWIDDNDSRKACPFFERFKMAI